MLLEGPRARWRELGTLMRVGRDFVRGFRGLHFVGPCVTIFGSARFDEDASAYQKARELGAAVARLGFTVMTGGGPGVMEAANRGARDVGGAVGGLQHRAALRAEPQSLPRSLGHLPLLLRAQGPAVQVLVRVRRPAGRARHARRADRGAHADPDAEDPPVPGRADGHGLLGAVRRDAAHDGAGAHHLGRRPRPDAGDRLDRRGDRPHRAPRHPPLRADHGRPGRRRGAGWASGRCAAPGRAS